MINEDVSDGVIIPKSELLTKSHEEGIQPINQSTELGDSLKELNQDDLDRRTRMSGIDMRARLHPAELPNIVALDALVALQILPSKCLAFTRQKKRLSVSLQGQGREEIVKIVGGKQDRDSNSTNGFMDKMQRMMGGGGE